METQPTGNLIIEGKTKRVFSLLNDPNLVFVHSKDRITAGDGAKAHDMAGKAVLSTQTNCAIFEFLNALGMKTHFVARCTDNPQAFFAKKCFMVPIEWVSRRVATGSYLRRNPHVKEGFRFAPPKLETFFKDDENHDPYWSLETLIEAGLKAGDVIIQKEHVNEMLRVTQLVFEVLERAWQTENHSLIDMKIEFGVCAEDGSLVVADCVDNDSWRLWPNGDKRLMLDKQIYRNLENDKIDQQAIQKVREKFEIVAQRTTNLFANILNAVAVGPEVGILLGSSSDLQHGNKIKDALLKLGVKNVELHICSAHKSTEFALEVVATLSQWPSCKAIIACAGRSNGLGPVSCCNTAIPVINCPPYSDMATLQVDIWSSLRLPSSMGATTILGPENAALAAAHIIACSSAFVWSKIRTEQTKMAVKMAFEDKKI